MTLESHEIYGNKKTLVILLPAASTVYNEYKRFIDRVEKIADVIFIDRGYFGLKMNYDIYDEYNAESFARKFLERFDKTIEKYNKVVLIGQSMGTIEAIALRNLIPNSKLILISPPITETKSKAYKIMEKVVSASIGNVLTRKAMNILEKSGVVTWGKRHSKEVIKDVAMAADKAGLVSWLSCMAEITKLGVFDKMVIPEDTIIIIGKNDPFLSALDQNKMRSRPNTLIINSRHGVLQQCPDCVFDNILKNHLHES